MDTRKILVITGDGGESYEALYAVHRFEEEGWRAVAAAPSRRRLNLVVHDFKPGWDTYIERRGYGLEAGLTFDEVKVDDYTAVLVLGGVPLSIFAITAKSLRSCATSIGGRSGFSASVTLCKFWRQDSHAENA